MFIFLVGSKKISLTDVSKALDDFLADCDEIGNEIDLEEIKLLYRNPLFLKTSPMLSVLKPYLRRYYE